MMNKKSMLLLIFVYQTTCNESLIDHPVDSLIDYPESPASDTVPIQRTTYLVFRRYYFIARLEKTIKLLEKINGFASKKELRNITNIHTPTPFIHETIHRSTQRIRNTKSLRPIFSVWDDFSSYKSLESDLVIDGEGLFVREFTHQLYLITKNVLDTLYYTQEPLKKYGEAAIKNLSSEQVLNMIDDVVDYIEKPSRYTQQNKQVNDIKVHASSDEINLRFYHIHRLEPAIQLLETVKEAEPELFDRVVKKSKSRLEPSQFNDHHTPIYEEINSSDDIFDEWQNFRQYRHIGEPNFSQDLFLLAFTVLKEICLAKNSHQSISFEEIISKTDPEDVLYAIDIISDELQAAVQEYQKDGGSINAWIHKKWWIPATALATIGLKFAHYCLTKL